MNLFSSSCLDSLLEQFCSDIITIQKDFWEKITVITPNNYVKQFIVSEFCLRNQVSINWQFSTLTQKLIELQEGEKVIFTNTKILNLAILEELSLNLENYPLLKKLISASEKKLSYLCWELAELFFSYIFCCPKLTKNWLNNKNFFAKKMSVEEEQKKLFFNIVKNKDNIIVMNNIVFPEIKTPPKKEKEKIFIFYPEKLTELQYELIENIAENNIFFIYQFVVCQEFLEDIEGKHTLVENNEEYENSLLNSWGSCAKQQAKNWSNLEENLENIFQSSFLKPINPISNNPTILQKVQEDIRYRKETKHSQITDKSLNFFSFPSKEQEIEFVYEEILFEIQKNHTPIDKIAVLVPKMREYKEKIEFIFKDIPHIIIDYSIAEESFLIRFLKDFFLFYKENLKRKAFFNILSNPVVQSKFSLNSQKIKKLFSLTEKYKIFQNYDSWEEILKKFRIAFFQSGNDENFNPENKDDILFLYDIIKGLLNKQKFVEQKHKISHWTDFINSIILEYTQLRQDFPKEQEAYGKLKHSLSNICKIYRKSSLSIGAKTLEESILQEIYKQTKPLGKEGVIISGIKPTIPLNAHHTFILGLDENSFPKKEITTTFDLKLSYNGRFKQTSQTENAEHTFLEILMNTQKKIHLSFVHQTQKEQIVVVQSPVINQMIHFLKKQNPNGKFTIEKMNQEKIETFHQKKTWFKKNIVRKENLFLSPNCKKTAHFNEKNNSEPFLNIKDLATSISNPLRFFFQVQLKMKENFLMKEKHEEIINFKERNLNGFMKKIIKESFDKNISPKEIIEEEFVNEQEKGFFLKGILGEKQKKKILNFYLWNDLESMIKKKHYNTVKTNFLVPFEKNLILLDKDCLLYQEKYGNYTLFLNYPIKSFQFKDILTSFFLLKEASSSMLEIKIIDNSKIRNYEFQSSTKELNEFLKLLIENYTKKSMTVDEINLSKKRDLLEVVFNKNEKEMSNELIRILLEEGKEQSYNKRYKIINYISNKLQISESNNEKFLQILSFLFTSIK